MATEMITHVSDPGVRAPIGIIGGSGFYSLFDEARSVDVYTPFGAPSEAPVVGTVGGSPVAFLPRHGKGHRYAPHRVNYRANLWALRAIGVRQVLAPCAVGSLVASQGPGTIVVPDQIIDRTWGRPHTYFEREGEVAHVAFADPFCPRGRAAALAAARELQREEADEHDVVDAGTLVVINGPRFSTRAESRWHAAAGGTVVGMTAMPEAALARELGLCFTTICLVTDLDAGFETDAGVTAAEVFAMFADNIDRVKRIVADAASNLTADLTADLAGSSAPTDESGGESGGEASHGDGGRGAPADDDPSAVRLPCRCADALEGMTVPFDLPQ